MNLAVGFRSPDPTKFDR